MPKHNKKESKQATAATNNVAAVVVSSNRKALGIPKGDACYRRDARTAPTI